MVLWRGERSWIGCCRVTNDSTTLAHNSVNNHHKSPHDHKSPQISVSERLFSSSVCATRLEDGHCPCNDRPKYRMI
eukprot:2934562-Pyramimonas_sp.AAC.4